MKIHVVENVGKLDEATDNTVHIDEDGNNEDAEAE